MGPRTAIVYRTSRHVRYALGGLTLAVLALAFAVAVLTLWVVELKNAHDQQAAHEQAQIDSAMCSVISQFPPGLNPTLDRVRVNLHCPTTLAGDR